MATCLKYLFEIKLPQVIRQKLVPYKKKPQKTTKGPNAIEKYLLIVHLKLVHVLTGISTAYLVSTLS